MPVLVGNTEMHLKPPVQNPLEIVRTMVKGYNDIISLASLGGHVAALHYLWPLIFR